MLNVFDIKKLSSLVWCAALAVATLPACALDGEHDADDDDEEAGEDLGTSEQSLASCSYSRSSQFMFPAARTAMADANVGTDAIIQSRGNARASRGTHCVEPGSAYSAATDISPGSKCGRVHALRMQGFAAWYRPSMNPPHIHMVWAGAPSLKSSLRNQVASFLRGGSGLSGGGSDNVCPITAAEKDAVRRGGGVGGPSVSGGNCVVGGYYCGQDKVGGDENTLYRCEGATAAFVRKCAGGCVVPVGRDDYCR